METAKEIVYSPYKYGNLINFHEPAQCHVHTTFVSLNAVPEGVRNYLRERGEEESGDAIARVPTLSKSIRQRRWRLRLIPCRDCTLPQPLSTYFLCVFKP